MTRPLTSMRTRPHYCWTYHQQTRVGCVSGDCGDLRRNDGCDGVRTRRSCHCDGGDDGDSKSDGDGWSHAVR